jgi:hypothetical protein
MFKEFLIANRGECGREAVSAKPMRLARAARARDFAAENKRV